MSAEAVVIWLFVGAVIGWLASQIMTKGGFGIQGDIMVGVAGAAAAGLLFPAFNIFLGGQQAPLLGHIVNAALGAVIGTFVGRMVFKPSQ